MAGHGSTEREAWSELYRRFYDYKTHGRQLPRPGTVGPIKIASQLKVDRYGRLAGEFFRAILDIDYAHVLITDQSSLWHFTADEEETKRKIRKVYGVDIEDVANGNLATIFERIEQERTAKVQSAD
jgi:hypothetical protein